MSEPICECGHDINCHYSGGCLRYEDDVDADQCECVAFTDTRIAALKVDLERTIREREEATESAESIAEESIALEAQLAEAKKDSERLLRFVALPEVTLSENPPCVKVSTYVNFTRYWGDTLPDAIRKALSTEKILSATIDAAIEAAEKESSE